MTRIALVTGGTRGIGAAIAKALKAAGYRVAANYHGNAKAAQAFHKETEIPVYSWDVSDFDACAKGVKQVEADLGKVEVLVNNAGITRDMSMHKMTLDAWNAVITTDLNSVFYMTHAIYPAMREAGFGRIINISSINGQRGQFGQVNYAAAKAGMVGFTKSLALEGAAKGITANVIAPGYIMTDMVAAMPKEILAKTATYIPVRRLGEVDEISRIAVFLAADNAGFITGSTISVNGGQYMI